MTSYPKSDSFVSRRVFTEGTILPNFIRTGLAMTQPYTFSEETCTPVGL